MSKNTGKKKKKLQEDINSCFFVREVATGYLLVGNSVQFKGLRVFVTIRDARHSITVLAQRHLSREDKERGWWRLTKEEKELARSKWEIVECVFGEYIVYKR